MIKDNLDDTNKIYLTLHEANYLFLKNYNIGWKAGSFYSVKNKEQWAEK